MAEPPATEHFDLSHALYDQYSALALGWVAAIGLAIYVVFLHNRINSIWKSHVTFAQKVVEDLKPQLSGVAAGIEDFGETQRALAGAISLMDSRQLILLGKMGVALDELQVRRSDVRPSPYKNPVPRLEHQTNDTPEG